MGKITIKDNGKEYTLEFNRYSIVEMEKRGFDITKAEARPLATLTEITRGAFIMHHSDMSVEEVDLIIDKIDDKLGLINALASMYKDAIESVLNGSKKGNATWAKA